MKEEKERGKKERTEKNHQVEQNLILLKRLSQPKEEEHTTITGIEVFQNKLTKKKKKNSAQSLI